MKTKLSQLFLRDKEESNDSYVRQKHDKEKLKQKMYFNKKTRSKIVKAGDDILVKQTKTTTNHHTTQCHIK